MTQEEKARAYDEALKRAKAAMDIAADKDLVGGVARTIFPELKESEDERVIRTLFSLCKDHDWLNGATKEECLNWLEKQKESLHITESCKENADSFTSQCGDNRFELIDKAKRDIIAKTNIESSPDEMKVLGSFLFRAWQMGWLGKYDVIVPEQKPVEIHIDNPNIQKFDPDVKVTTSDSSASGDELLYVSNKSYNIGYRDGKRDAQKPAEWSEEDEENMQAICTYLQDYPRLAKINDAKRFNEYCDWLKSLRPQSKEELAKMLQDEYNKGKEIGEREGHTKGYNKGYKDAEEAYNRAVSYHLDVPDNWPPKMPDLPTKATTNDIQSTAIPHWKPSEDEERLINTSISFLKDFADKGYENAVECIDWLKSKLNGNSGK